MSTTPFIKLSSIFNPNDFTLTTDGLTIANADQRYLQLSGGLITGNLNVNGTIDAGNLSINGQSLSLDSITGVVAGTASASKALILNSSSSITGINQLSATQLNAGSITSGISTINSGSYIRVNSTNTSALPDTTPASGYSIVLHNGDIATNSNCGISFLCSTSFNGYSPTAVIEAYRTGSNGAGGLIFATRESTLATGGCGERVRITPAGFVGINNTTPSFLLDVGGDSRCIGNLICGPIALPQAKLHIKSESGSSGWVNVSRIEHSANSCIFDIQMRADTSSEGISIGSVSNHQLGFMTNNTRKMILTTGGSIRIDDNQAFILCRDVLTGDINSQIRCVTDNISSLVIESSRGNGSVQIISNRAGVSSDSPCFMLKDGSESSFPYLSAFRNGCIQLSVENSMTKPDNALRLSIPDGGIWARNFIANSTKPSAPSTFSFDTPSFIWMTPTNPCGIGLYNSGTRCIIGTLASFDSSSGTYTWNSGVSAWAGSWNTTSDIRSKRNIVACPYGLNEVLQMHPCQYEIKATGETTIGLIAQELLHIAPVCVEEPPDADEDDSIGSMFGLNYNSLIGVLITAIQEQERTIRSNREQLLSQQSLIEKLELAYRSWKGDEE